MPKKIMIVDDNPDIVETLKTIMEAEGQKTDTAYNGKEFLAKTKKAKPDLVLLDVMMPGLTTKEIIEKLKAMKLKLKILLVTVVRFSDEEKDILMKSYNIVDYITKPFDVADLVKRVKAQL
jgi:DNA-binding response OmpR family regulator